MQSDSFSPDAEVPVETVRNLFTKQAKPVNMFTNESPDELKPKIK